MRYRVDELAARCGVTVDTVHFYRARGLLDPPRREGRVAWYDDDHVERLGRIRAWRDQGLSLDAIQRLLAGQLEASDAALVTALSSPERSGRLLTREELAERTGMSPVLLEAIEREGLLAPRTVAGEARYTADDAEAVRAGLAMLEAGVPLSELLDLARRHDEAIRSTADQAVDLFVRFVRDPILGSATSPQDASARLVTAFQGLLDATSSLVTHHYRSVLLALAHARVDTTEAADPGGATPP
ncbi:MAG: MerR family transcriptional regulator [Actinomycetota bacterium]|nr:MerR family transcriptional regulator [Actinomycetota bacterium]